MPLRLKRIAAVFAAAWMGCLCAQVACAASAANEHVTVSCEAPRVYIEVNANHFDVYAPGYPDAFVTNVMVRANGSWVLVKPTPAELPLKMSGGDTEPYRVVRPPEDAAGGTISFHNYYIKSNCDGGAKEIVVPAGTSVTYTAYKNGSTCPSDWTVNGNSRNNTASIVFNRHWWDVPSWFIPSMDTPQPDVYGVNAHDVQYARLKDSGEMTVVGVDHIEAKQESDSFESANNHLYVEKGLQLMLKAFPSPLLAHWPHGTPVWNNAEPVAAGSDVAFVDTSSVGSFSVTVSCGSSSKSIQVTVYECKVNIYVKPPHADAPVGVVISLLSSPKYDFDVGHTSWMMEVVPRSAKNHIKSFCTRSDAKHLNVCVGYYPSVPVSQNNLSVPGILRLGDSSEGTAKTFVVTTRQLVAGLEHTYSIERHPKQYILGTHVYIESLQGEIICNEDYPSDRNCTSICLEVLNVMGVSSLNAYAIWNGIIDVSSTPIFVEYSGNCPWKLYKQISR